MKKKKTYNDKTKKFKQINYSFMKIIKSKKAKSKVNIINILQVAAKKGIITDRLNS